MWVCAAFILFNAPSAMVLWIRLVWENKKADGMYGKKVEGGGGGENGGAWIQVHIVRD